MVMIHKRITCGFCRIVLVTVVVLVGGGIWISFQNVHSVQNAQNIVRDHIKDALAGKLISPSSFSQDSDVNESEAAQPKLLISKEADQSTFLHQRKDENSSFPGNNHSMTTNFHTAHFQTDRDLQNQSNATKNPPSFMTLITPAAALGMTGAAPISPAPSQYNITYQILPKDVVNHAEEWSSCQPGLYTNRFGRHGQIRKPLFHELAKLVNFSTRLSLTSREGGESSLSSTLKMVVIGDSVGMQIFHMLDMAMGGHVANRTVLENAFEDHISYGLSSTGQLGAMRMTGMLLRENENKPLPNAGGGGWNQTMIRALLNTRGMDGKPTSAFDVILLRIPHGWLELDEITDVAIKESLELASTLLGVKRAILLSLPFSNNIKEPRTQWLHKNRAIHHLVNTFEPNKTVPGIDRLFLMDIAQLTDEMIQINARHLGYCNDTQCKNMTYLNVRLIDYIKKASPAAAHVCAGPMFKKETRLLCDKNAITVDGMHFCSHTYGGRIVAATGCLLKCLYGTSNTRLLLPCQKQCNDNFMTLKPVQIEMD